MSKKIANFVVFLLAILLIVGAIGALFYFTNGFNEAPTSFYAVVNGDRVNSLAKGYDLGEKPLTVDVHYIFDSSDKKKDYSLKVVPHLNEDKDFTFTVSGKSYKFSEVGDLTKGFNITYDGMSFVLSTKGNLQQVLSAAYGSEVTELSSVGYPDMFELQIISYNEKSVISILFTLPDKIFVEGIELDQDEVRF